MGTLEKRKERILKIPKDYTYTEAKQFLLSLGFAEFNKGKTSGSRVKFYRQSDKKIILLHKPHPGDVMDSLTVKDLVSSLKKIWRFAMNILEYKGYRGKVEYDAENFMLHGKVVGIDDLITFEGNSEHIEDEFHSAVDDYLEFCEEVGKSPEKEYCGSFNIRIKPELHKKLALKARTTNESLNSLVEKAIVVYLKRNPAF